MLAVEGEAAQERRVAAYTARGTNCLAIDFEQAMGQEGLCIGRAVACMTASTYTRPQPGDKHFGQGVLCR